MAVNLFRKCVNDSRKLSTASGKHCQPNSGKYNCSRLTTIESLIEEPFAFDNRMVNDFSKVILFVPAGMKSKYESTDGWNIFHHIVEGNPAHVDEGLQVENDISTVYNLSGHRIASPQRGINIVRTKDGKIKKVLVE